MGYEVEITLKKTNLKKHEDISSINKMPRDEIEKKNPIKKLKTKQIENKRMRTKSDIKTKQNQILRDEIKKKNQLKKWFKTNRNEKNND